MAELKPLDELSLVQIHLQIHAPYTLFQHPIALLVELVNYSHNDHLMELNNQFL